MKIDARELKKVMQQSGIAVKEKTLETTVVSDPEALLLLKDEWDALWARAGGRHNQAFEVCWLAWTRVAKPRGCSLRCIVCREDGELVLVWPLVCRRRLIWTILEPLTPGTAEQTHVLASADAHRAIDAAWDAASRRCGGDIVNLPYVARNTRLNAHAVAARGHVSTTVDVCATALLREQPDWAAYTETLGTLSKRKPGALERRFAKEGVVDVRIVSASDTQSHARWVDWILSHKRDWSKRVAKHGQWLESNEYRDFLVDLLDGTRRQPLSFVMVMTLDGEPVVASIMGLGATCASGLIAGFDSKYSRFAPGNILMEHSVKWAWDNHFDLDFGVGKEEFKAYWSRNNVAGSDSHVVAISRFGRLTFQARRLTKKLASLSVRPPRFPADMARDNQAG